MDLIINSLYSDKDIFVRELVSNAADACDKKRFLSISTSSASSASSTSDDSTTTMDKPSIRIKCNPDENTIMIEDSGVGMTKDELINNLGKIAQSGTRNFVQALGEGSTSDVNLIGQFGVGFYSSYLVANNVQVVTKSMQDGAKQYKWQSTADSSYTIEEMDENSDTDNEITEPIATSGTRIILNLKDEAAEYLEWTKMEELLNRYSEFIEFPILLWKETTDYEQVPDDEANKDLPVGETPKTKTVPVTKAQYEAINTQKPIWLRSPKDVTDQEYQDFYKAAFRAAYDTPMKYTHFVLEGQVECKSILYIPGMLPFELSKDMFDDNARNIRLYVKRVFINDKFDELIPRWLKFVKGVVDSDDLPLNVSREILQKSKVLSIINKRLVRKSLDMIREIAENTEDPSQYVLFWNNFGKYLKVGSIEDDVNRKDIAPLLRFYSNKSGDEYTSLEAYVKNMPEGQTSIYYVTGDGKEGAAMSPVVEKLTSRGYEVLYATEPLDEIMMENLRSYAEKDIMDAAKENLKLDKDEDEETKKKKEELATEYQNVVTYMEVLLKDKVQKVTVSDLLTNSPAALVQAAYGMSPSMQRYMRAQAVAAGDKSGMGNFGRNSQAVLEINPNHPIVKDLDRMLQEQGNESKECEQFALLLYDVAALTSGYDVDNVKNFAQRVMKLMDPSVDYAEEESTTASTTTTASVTDMPVVDALEEIMNDVTEKQNDTEMEVTEADDVTNASSNEQDDDDEDKSEAKAVEVIQ
jgi:molecular chaperone HtpG